MKPFNPAVFSYVFDGLVQYFVEPIALIFGPDENIYPEIGVQPFEGEYYSKWVEP